MQEDARCAEYRAKNKTAINKREREWRKENPEKIKASNKSWH